MGAAWGGGWGYGCGWGGNNNVYINHNNNFVNNSNRTEHRQWQRRQWEPSATAIAHPLNLPRRSIAIGNITRSTVAAPLTPTEPLRIGSVVLHAAIPWPTDRQMHGRTKVAQARQQPAGGRDMSNRGAGPSAGTRDTESWRRRSKPRRQSTSIAEPKRDEPKRLWWRFCRHERNPGSRK